MLLNELDPNTDLKDVDLLDDLHFFMTNDPVFYRKILHPIVITLKKHLKSDTKCDHAMFKSAVDDGVKAYCNKFKIEGNPKSVFTDVDRDELARKIFSQQTDHIQSQHELQSQIMESDKDLEKSLDPMTRRELKHIASRHPHETDELAAFIADTEERLGHLEYDQDKDHSEVKRLKSEIQRLSALIDRATKR